MKSRIGRGLMASLAGIGLVGMVGAGVASAHIEPDPAAVEAGKAATVGFNVEHGCDGSPTTRLDIQVPSNVSDAAPITKDGWTSAVDGNVIRFSGGSLDATTPDTFSITFTAPATPGVINFPVVQTCAVGETDWLDIAVEGQAEPEHPAPAVKITDGPPTADDLAADHDEEATTEGTGAHDHDETATSTDGVTTTSTDSSDDDDSNTGVIVVVVIVAVLVVGAGGVLAARSRGNRSQK